MVTTLERVDEAKGNPRVQQQRRDLEDFLLC